MLNCLLVMLLASMWVDFGFAYPDLRLNDLHWSMNLRNLRNGTDFIRTIADVSLESCREECNSRPACKSVNYHHLRKSCELHATSSPFKGKLKICTPCIFAEKSKNNATILCEATCGSGEKCLDGPAGSLFCLVEECIFPSPSAGVIQLGNKNGVGNRIKLKCDSSSNSFQTILTCLNNGTWGGKELICNNETGATGIDPENEVGKAPQNGTCSSDQLSVGTGPLSYHPDGYWTGQACINTSCTDFTDTFLQVPDFRVDGDELDTFEGDSNSDCIQQCLLINCHFMYTHPHKGDKLHCHFIDVANKHETKDGNAAFYRLCQ